MKTCWTFTNVPFSRTANRTFSDMLDFLGRASMPAAAVYCGGNYERKVFADKTELQFFLPGVAPERIAVTAENGEVKVSVAEKASAEESSSSERKNVWLQSVKLEKDIDIEKITAEAKHGVLTVTVPFSEQSRPREIPIASAA